MAEVINMPRLSDTMEEGTVASWLKKVGDKIEEGIGPRVSAGGITCVCVCTAVSIFIVP